MIQTKRSIPKECFAFLFPAHGEKTAVLLDIAEKALLLSIGKSYTDHNKTKHNSYVQIQTHTKINALGR